MKKHVLTRLSKLAEWGEEWKVLSTDEWQEALAVGKWCPRDVVAHLKGWDDYFLEVVLPKIQAGDTIEFPDFHFYNERSVQYGKEMNDQLFLLNELIDTRIELLNEVILWEEEKMVSPIVVNGLSHCPHTHEPYSLMLLLTEIVHHDMHHYEQIQRSVTRV